MPLEMKERRKKETRKSRGIGIMDSYGMDIGMELLTDVQIKAKLSRI